jgi:hypothetical protein
LAIHAAATRRDDRCRDLGFAPETLAYGAVIGMVDLVEIRLLDAEAYAALQPQHRSEISFPGAPCYAWFFTAAQRLPEPLPVTGRRRLFEAPLGEAAEQRESDKTRQQEGSSPKKRDSNQQPASSNPYRALVPQPDPTRPFALYAVPEEGGGYRVALYQWINVGQVPASTAAPQAPGALWSVDLGGDALRAVMDHLLAALRANDYKATDLARSVGNETPFYLNEPSGLRLALILMAVKPLARHDRIEAIGQGIQAMSAEEAYYWFSKCTAGADAVRAQKALRILLAGD